MSQEQLIVGLVAAIWLFAVLLSVALFLRNRKRTALYKQQASQAQTILEIARYQAEQTSQKVRELTQVINPEQDEVLLYAQELHDHAYDIARFFTREPLSQPA